MSLFRHQAIYNTHSNVVGINEHRGAIDKDDNIVTLDETKVAEEEAKLQADYDSKQYKRDRVEQYPSIQDVVVALAEKEEGDDTMWKEITAKRQKVKADNPKPE